MENKQTLRNEAEALMRKLTLEEKIGMIHGAELFCTAPVERLGIPALVMSDGPMGVRQEFEPDNWKSVGNHDDYVTYLPCNSALAATWNRELARAAGEVLGAEARGRGKDVILGPGVNIRTQTAVGSPEVVSVNVWLDDAYASQEEVNRWAQLPQAVKELAEKMGAPEDLIEYMGPRYTAPGNNPDT